MTRPPGPGNAPASLPIWMRRTGAGLTALVAVLFVVLLLQVRQQSQRIQGLQDKLQTIENANDLGRTNALEEQLRSTVDRLQALEGLEDSVQRLSSEQASLRQQLGAATREPGLSLDGDLGAPRPNRAPTPPPLPLGQP